MNIDIEKNNLNLETGENGLDMNTGASKVIRLENDYEKLKNKPSINGVELLGNKSLEELGIQNKDETDPTVPSHVKNIKETDINNWNDKSNFSGDYNDLVNKPKIPSAPTKTSELENDSGFITKDDVPSSGVSMKNISDVENKSLNANDIENNVFIENGYFDDNGEYIQLTSKPTIITSLNDTITSLGYYACHNSMISEGGKNYTLVEPKTLALGKKIYQMLANPSLYGTVLTRNFRTEPNNSNIFGSENKLQGDNATTFGQKNVSIGDYNFVVGIENNVVGQRNLVGGEYNVVKTKNATVFGSDNEANENQATVGGIHNKALDGAYFSTIFGAGNITQGTATTAHGGYNLAGSEYCSVDGMDNIAGGNVTYDGAELATISRYSASTTYTTGKMCKRNGYVFKALKSVTGIAPNPGDEEGNWEVVEPVVTEDYARCAKASGEKCKSTHNGSYTHGYYLISGRDYQTVLGRYNEPVENAMFVVGNGTSKNDRKNALVVYDDNIVEILENLNVLGNLNLLGNLLGNLQVNGSEIKVNSTDEGDKSLVFSQQDKNQFRIRTNASGQVIFDGTNGLYIRARGTNATGVKFDGANIIPEKNGAVSLGGSTNLFENAYINGLLVDTLGNSVSVANIKSGLTNTLQIQIPVSSWVNGKASVTVSGIYASSIVITQPSPASAIAYKKSNIICTAQDTNLLTFTCESVPTETIKINVLIK